MRKFYTNILTKVKHIYLYLRIYYTNKMYHLNNKNMYGFNHTNIDIVDQVNLYPFENLKKKGGDFTNITFSIEDCWVLFSIPNNSGGGNLIEIIDLSDAFNHSVPTEIELKIALTKGVQAGLITYERGRFYPSPILWELKEKIIDANGGLHSFPGKLHKELRNSEFKKINDQQVNFFSGEYKFAFSLYSDRFWNASYSLK